MRFIEAATHMVGMWLMFGTAILAIVFPDLFAILGMLLIVGCLGFVAVAKWSELIEMWRDDGPREG